MNPDSPLPWKTGRLEEGSSPSKEVRTEDRSMDYLGRLETKARTERDAEYIAHACNGYPKLKAALLSVIAQSDNIGDGDLPHDVLTMLRENDE